MVVHTNSLLEVVMISSMELAPCMSAFITYMVVQFGVTSPLTSVHGWHFTSLFFAGLCQLLGVQHPAKIANHLHCKGVVEPNHWQLKNRLA